MFGKLYLLVKENMGISMMENARIPSNAYDSVINEASGTIIDVLKSQIDCGKASDLLTFFNIANVEDNALVRTITSKYAIRLNKYYGVHIADAKILSEKLIPAVMKKFILLAKDGKKSDHGVFAFFNKLSGYTVNFETLFGKMPQVQLA